MALILNKSQFWIFVLTSMDLNMTLFDKNDTEISSFLRQPMIPGASHHTLTSALTHWGRVTHIYVSKLTIIGSDNDLWPSRRQSIIWTNAGILLIRPSGTNFSEILIEIDIFSFKKMHLKVSSAKRRPFCLGLNVLPKWLNWLLLGIRSFDYVTPALAHFVLINNLSVNE